jgi:hypothetical protein
MSSGVRSTTRRWGRGVDDTTGPVSAKCERGKGHRALEQVYTNLYPPGGNPVGALKGSRGLPTDRPTHKVMGGRGACLSPSLCITSQREPDKNPSPCPENSVTPATGLMCQIG